MFDARREEPRERLDVPVGREEGRRDDIVLSGSPVMLYHNGTKATGICYGSEQQRVLASEIVDSHDGDVHYRETVNRVVELGLALRSEAITSFAAEIPDCEPVVTADRVPDPELE